MPLTYRIDCLEKGVWVTKCTTGIEDAETFNYIANATEYKYRILCDGKDVTKNYKAKKSK